MVGSRESHCQVDGTWDPHIPVCEQMVQCLPPPDIQNGTHNNQKTGVFPSGIFVKYTCDPGYALIGETTLHCTNAGRWSSPAPNCKGIFSPHVSLPPLYLPISSMNTKYESTQSTFFLNLFFFPIFSLFPLVVQCQPPPNIQNGTRSNQETAVFPSGMLVKYTCNPGYALIGEATIQCIDNGMWSSPAPTCEAILCSSPPNIPHSKNTGKSLKYFLYGTTVTYTCDKGYPVIGNASIYCTSKDGITGEWSGRVYCGGEVSCSNLGIVAGVSSTYKYNQKVSFDCFGGHKMIGSRETHCQVDGMWDPPIPDHAAALLISSVPLGIVAESYE
uniref:Sushi domain-containing protein n=1 Tax=Pseudonaja textilis TaxID=8673 RepID=A0A670Z9P1_PSETE